MSGGCTCGQGITPNYRIYDYTVLIKLTIWTGRVRWGECFGVVAPEIVSTIVGRSSYQVAAFFDDMYDSGYFGGFWLVAIHGLDMALWDLQGKMLDLPVFFCLAANVPPSCQFMCPAYRSPSSMCELPWPRIG